VTELCPSRFWHHMSRIPDEIRNEKKNARWDEN
jgi:hypothetical protein